MQRFDVLNVELFPNARLKRARNVVEIPAESQALGHPELIRLGQLLPVPTNLSTTAQTSRIQVGHDVETDDSGQDAREIDLIDGRYLV